MDPKLQECYRKIPGIDRLLNQEKLQSYIAIYGKKVVSDGARAVTGRLRDSLDKGEIPEEEITCARLTEAVRQEVFRQTSLHLRKVINGSGVLLHTNLGRAPLCREHLQSVCQRMDGYTSLELDLSDGSRGWREDAAEERICQVTGAQAALVVNNNAAAVLLALSALSKGREVLVSRGELIEIGGKFRIPDVIEQSGCILKEVGCTNRTRLLDYEQAMSQKTGAILKVHTSNYRIVGFTESVLTSSLKELGNRWNVPVIEDLGSGALVDLCPYGLNGAPTVQESLRRGADVVAFSGDKLLGGPQAGILLGKREYIRRMAGHPLMRALRPDKFLLALLEQTFFEYQDETLAFRRIPILKMIQTPVKVLKNRAETLLNELSQDQPAAIISVEESDSVVGGGALPDETLKSYALVLYPRLGTVLELKQRLLEAEIPVLSRIREDALWLDLRAVQPEELPILTREISKALEEMAIG